jgi:hypothetical protein
MSNVLPVLFGLLTIAATPALAEEGDYTLKLTTKAAASPCLEPMRIQEFDKKITNCTAAIESGEFSGDDLAELLWQRGIAYQLKVYSGDSSSVDRAIADFSDAIRLKPKVPDFYASRADAYATRGLTERESTDRLEFERLYLEWEQIKQ